MMVGLWHFIEDSWHVFVALVLVISLPFAMNQLEARESLLAQIEDARVKLDAERQEMRAEAPANLNTLEASWAKKEKCLRFAEAIVRNHIEAGVHRGDVWLIDLRRVLAKGCCGPEALKPDPDREWVHIVKLMIPNLWPSTVLTFFVVSVSSIIGYAGTTLRSKNQNEPRELFDPSRAVLAAILAFGFLLALKSSYSLAFTIDASDQKLNVFGLAFIGLLVGLFTEQAYSFLARLFKRVLNAEKSST